MSSLAVGNLIQTIKMISAEYGLPKKIISDAGRNFTSEIFRLFGRQMSIEQFIT